MKVTPIRLQSFKYIALMMNCYGDIACCNFVDKCTVGREPTCALLVHVDFGNIKHAYYTG